MSVLKIGGDDKLLRIKDLSEGLAGTKCAYLLRVRRHTDRNGEMYLNFHLKTVDGASIIGRKFRISADNNIGKEMLSVQRAVVDISFVTQVYKGSYVLLIDSIEFSNAAEPELFFDDYKAAAESYDLLVAKSAEFGCREPSETLKRISLLSIMNGKQGGILYLFRATFASLSSYDGESFFPSMIKTFMAVLSPYVSYCQLLDKVEFVSKAQQLKFLFDLEWITNENEKSMAIDTLSSLIGLANPEHIVAHLITKTLKSMASQLNMIERVKSSPVDTIIDFEGERLISY